MGMETEIVEKLGACQIAAEGGSLACARLKGRLKKGLRGAAPYGCGAPDVGWYRLPSRIGLDGPARWGLWWAHRALRGMPTEIATRFERYLRGVGEGWKEIYRNERNIVF